MTTITATENLSEEFAEADRAYRDAEDAVNLALARLRAATSEHRQAGANWSHAMEIRNQRLKQRADLLAKIEKEKKQ